ncbi:MAG: molybdate ABC transporter substrate-binding protein, partial [Actinobacteria bacterium]|nr:molybdate ABC transporter substrate-binding protein [Actinomycetota bacterium]
MLRRRVLTTLSAQAAAVVIAACGTPAPPAPPTATAPAEPTPVPPTLAPAPAATPTPFTRLSEDPTAVVVFAATPLGNALSELGSDFMLAAPQATGVDYRFDKPDQLRTLIQAGADADVFVSMDSGAMDALGQSNLLDGAPTVLVRDRLVIVVSQANPQGIQSLADLARTGVRYIVPAPTSQTSQSLMAAFQHASADPTYGADFAARADRNVLARDGDDRLVIDRITSGEVTAGVVYASSVTLDARPQVNVVAVPDAISPLIDFPIAVLKNGTNVRGGQAFVQYALSSRAQDILSRYGFVKIGNSS